MENKIPTVDEFVKSRFQNSDRADFESNKRNVIEFAKIHVKESLKTVAKKAIEMNQWENKKISKKNFKVYFLILNIYI